jgi:hypothetical protein
MSSLPGPMLRHAAARWQTLGPPGGATRSMKTNPCQICARGVVLEARCDRNDRSITCARVLALPSKSGKGNPAARSQTQARVLSKYFGAVDICVCIDNLPKCSGPANFGRQLSWRRRLGPLSGLDADSKESGSPRRYRSVTDSRRTAVTDRPVTRSRQGSVRRMTVVRADARRVPCRPIAATFESSQAASQNAHDGAWCGDKPARDPLGRSRGCRPRFQRRSRTYVETRRD